MMWTVKLEGCPRRVNHAAVCVGNRIFSFGGYCTGMDYKSLLPIDIFVLDTLTNRWLELPKPDPIRYGLESSWPFRRYGHTVVVYGEEVFLFGGRNDVRPCNDVFAFNTRTYRWRRTEAFGECPAPQDGHSACVIDHFMYVFGGCEDSLDFLKADIFRFDLDSGEWKVLSCSGEVPLCRDFHTSTAVDDRIYIFGGRCDQTNPQIRPGLDQEESQGFYPNTVICLDTRTNVWTTLCIQGPKPSGRRSHSAVNLDGDEILIFGGFNGRDNVHLNDLWSLDTRLLRWRRLTPRGVGPDPRRRQAICKCGDRLFLFGGTSPYHGPPIDYTPTEIEFLPHNDRLAYTQLIDHSDMYVLDLAVPSLKTLAKMCVIQNKVWLNVKELPLELLEEIRQMTEKNTVSQPLKFKLPTNSG